MTELTSETLKSYIQADRRKLLEKIEKDMSSVSPQNSTEYLSKFGERVNSYMNLAIPEVLQKKRKVKVERFRKVSPYFAYCTNFRNSKRDKQGKLTANVLEITKEAGANWRKMSEKDRKPWIENANKLTAQAKVAWDKTHSTPALSVSSAPSVPSTPSVPSASPTPKAIREMKKTDLLQIAESQGVSVPTKISLKALRDLIVAHFTPVVPTTNQITKMKKSELLALVEKAGIVSDKDTKTMQQALISHYNV